MIGKLKGLVDEIGDNYVLLDVGGVCYLVFLSKHSMGQLPAIGQATMLLIETHVREDHIHLYGFVDAEEKQWFNTLTTVKGVGTKMALSFLSTLSPSQISLALAAQDTTALIQVSGVGKKLAERVITELKDKVKTLPTSGGGLANISSGTSSSLDLVVNDAVSALTNLGYNRSDALLTTSKIVADNPEISVENLIRTALREL